MYNDELLAAQRSRSEHALLLMRDLLPLITPVARHPEWTNEERSTLGMLLTSCARSTESALLLCAYGQLWDAEVILRSVAEGTLKLAFILQSDTTFKERIREYSVDHFNISLLKDDKKIRELLSIVQGWSDARWRPLTERLLSPEELNRLATRYDRKSRQSIETRWGVSGILAAFRRDKGPHTGRLPGLLHNYALASHIQHADYIGISIVDDRERREPHRRDAIHLAHLSRLISDAFSYFLIRATSGYTFIKADLAPLRSAANKVAVLREEQGDVYSEWMDIEYGTESGRPKC